MVFVVRMLVHKLLDRLIITIIPIKSSITARSTSNSIVSTSVPRLKLLLPRLTYIPNNNNSTCNSIITRNKRKKTSDIKRLRTSNLE